MCIRDSCQCARCLIEVGLINHLIGDTGVIGAGYDLIQPVSYTHLDVYKRQLSVHFRFFLRLDFVLILFLCAAGFPLQIILLKPVLAFFFFSQLSLIHI